MDQNIKSNFVRERLIIEGIKELEQNGIANFSLRKVASSCGVSCAAPYKHFNNKENFIVEIILYIHNKWVLLQNEVIEFYKDDVKKQIVETCIAYIKLWIANPNFRTVLMSKTNTITDPRINVKNKMTECTERLIDEYCRKYNISKEVKEIKIFTIRSLVYGAALMLDNGELKNTKETIEMIRKRITEELI